MIYSRYIPCWGGRFGAVWDDSRPRDDERRVSPIRADVSSADSSPTIRGYG